MLERKRIIIISPSGNFYGSEQVLFDYLNVTSLSGLVFVPSNSPFYVKLVERKFANFQIRGFDRSMIPSLYLSIARILFTGKYEGVYLNEAGHIRYFGLLKLFFPSKDFVIHVRLTEDAAHNRWSSIFRNKLKAITISRFIERMLPVPSLMIYDPFNFRNNIKPATRYSKESKFNVGIIGRVTSTKGSFRFPGIIEELNKQEKLDRFQFHFYGDICEDFNKSGLVNSLSSTGAVSFHGFVSDSSLIYNNLQAVLHLSENEPLGRIFLEALNEEIPFIGINGGGIGEMAGLLGMNDFVVDPAGNDINVQIADRLLFIKDNFDKIQSQISDFKQLGRTVFDPVAYARKLDSCF